MTKSRGASVHTNNSRMALSLLRQFTFSDFNALLVLGLSLLHWEAGSPCSSRKKMLGRTIKRSLQGSLHSTALLLVILLLWSACWYHNKVTNPHSFGVFHLKYWNQSMHLLSGKTGVRDSIGQSSSDNASLLNYQLNRAYPVSRGFLRNFSALRKRAHSHVRIEPKTQTCNSPFEQVSLSVSPIDWVDLWM